MNICLEYLWLIIVIIIVIFAGLNYIGGLIERKKLMKAILKETNGKHYIGTRSSGKFHYYQCTHIIRYFYPGKRYEITFSTPEEAQAKGYRWCDICYGR